MSYVFTDYLLMFLAHLPGQVLLLKLFFPDVIHRNLFIPVHEWHVVCQLSLFYKLAVSTNF